MIAQVISTTLEVLFTFNFYEKLGKDVIQIRTMPQKPSRKLKGFCFGKNSL